MEVDNKNLTSTASSEPPVLSVVIACFNQSRELDLTLESLLNQSFSREKYELLIIDDHSGDLSARQVTAKYRRLYPDAAINYVRQYRPDGGTYGCSAQVKNIGIRCARGKYVFFNNAEIVQAGQSLDYIVGRMESSPVPLCLRGRVIDLPYEELTGKSPEELDLLHDGTDLRRERVATADHAGLAVIDRLILNKVGGIDERFDYWGKEDLDMAARLKRVQVQYIYDEKMKSFHIHHPRNHVKEGHYLRMCSLLEENNRRQIIEANVGGLWGNLTPVPSALLDGTVIAESKGELENLKQRLEMLIYPELSTGSLMEVWVVCCENIRSRVEPFLRKYYRTVSLLVVPDEPSEIIGSYLLSKVRTQKAAFMPEGFEPSFIDWEAIDPVPGGFVPWVGDVKFPAETARAQQENVDGWLSHTLTAINYLSSATSMEEWRCAEMLKKGISTIAPRPPGCLTEESMPVSINKSEKPPAITLQSRVMALVPHYKCEEWLSQCLESLVNQTRQLDAIVVVDDNSSTPPLDIVQRFPQVTLMTTAENVGPYRLIQQVIDGTDFDAYMFQDADDWSSADRLESLLREAERTGAELIGSQELRLICTTGADRQLRAVCYPLDVNRALAERPGHPLLHPTSMVSKDLVGRVGGFAVGLRFGGDTEFLLRAVHLARIVNLPCFGYYRRHRTGSLTTDPHIGLDSPVREELLVLLKKRARDNTARLKNGQPLLLEPLKTRPPVELKYLCGPDWNISGPNEEQR